MAFTTARTLLELRSLVEKEERGRNNQASADLQAKNAAEDQRRAQNSYEFKETEARLERHGRAAIPEVQGFDEEMLAYFVHGLLFAPKDSAFLGNGVMDLQAAYKNLYLNWGKEPTNQRLFKKRPAAPRPCLEFQEVASSTCVEERY